MAVIFFNHAELRELLMIEWGEGPQLTGTHALRTVR